MGYPGKLIGYVHYTLDGLPVDYYDDSNHDEADYDDTSHFFINHDDPTPCLCGLGLSKEQLKVNVVKDIGQNVYQIPIYVYAPQIGLK